MTDMMNMVDEEFDPLIMTVEEYDSHHKILNKQHEQYVIQNDQLNKDCLDNIFHPSFNLNIGTLSVKPVTIQPVDIKGADFNQIVIFDPDIIFEQKHSIGYNNDSRNGDSD